MTLEPGPRSVGDKKAFRESRVKKKDAFSCGAGTVLLREQATAPHIFRGCLALSRARVTPCSSLGLLPKAKHH